MGVRLQKNILLIAAISSLRAFPSLSKILSRRFSGKVWRPFLTDPLVFLSSLLHCKSFVRQCSQRCCAESGQTVFAPSGWFSFSASKTSPERLRKPGEFSLSRRFITETAFPERPIFSRCFRCIFDFKFSVLSNGSFGWGNRGKRCHWKDNEESATDRHKNGG